MREGVVLWIQDGDLREGEDIVGKRGSVMGGGGWNGWGWGNKRTASNINITQGKILDPLVRFRTPDLLYSLV